MMLRGLNSNGILRVLQFTLQLALLLFPPHYFQALMPPFSFGFEILKNLQNSKGNASIVTVLIVAAVIVVVFDVVVVTKSDSQFIGNASLGLTNRFSPSSRGNSCLIHSTSFTSISLKLFVQNCSFFIQVSNL